MSGFRKPLLQKGHHTKQQTVYLTKCSEREKNSTTNNKESFVYNTCARSETVVDTCS